MTYARLNFIVEGQTEETFVNQVLRPHLATLLIGASARCVATRSKGHIKYRGGVTSYTRARLDITSWLKEDHTEDAYFTTMFDTYGLPNDFPGYEDAGQKADPYDKVRTLENALFNDIADDRLIPYLQLHEFETLILAEPQRLESQFIAHSEPIQRLLHMAARFGNPELINDSPVSAPSKRIVGEIPEYAGMKASASPIVAGKIGLPTLRERCAHFADWLVRLETLTPGQPPPMVRANLQA